MDDNEKEGQLPDLDLSVDQLFFIGFAMVGYAQLVKLVCNAKGVVFGASVWVKK